MILGVASGLRASHLLPFLRSLRATSYRGRVVLFVARTDPADVRELREWADVVRLVDDMYDSKRISARIDSALRWLRATPRIRRAYPLAFRLVALGLPGRRRELEYRLEGLQALRYRLYLDYLEADGQDADRVFITDLRDVLFQDDPFAHDPYAELETFLEDPHVTIGDNAFNGGWISNLYGRAGLRRVAPHVVSCSGTTMGTGAGMRRYLTLMAKEVERQRRPLSAHDQGMHNYLLRTGGLAPVNIWENRAAPVFTMGEAKEFRRDHDGRVLNDNGSVPAVLHQYDRHASLAEALRERAAQGWGQGSGSARGRR